MAKNYSILDCTLRDGGYYNAWDFDRLVVDEYLKTMSEARVEYVELGLRNFAKDSFLGAFAYTTEEYINQLELPEGPSYGVMVDAKTILTSGMDIKTTIDRLFVPCEKSKLSLVRVAAHFGEVEKCGEISLYLKQLGYKVGFNLMQAGGKESRVITNKAALVKSWNCVDVLYFADSLGNMDAKEVARIVKAIRESWSGELGIHTHDNMGNGLSNSLAALDEGVTWLDSTITGMGRGAGNTQTELLMASLTDGESKYQVTPVYELVVRYFESMQKQYGWGSNLLYFLGAKNDIHPTYIQNLLSDEGYGKDEIVGAIRYLSQLEDASSYDGDLLDSAMSFSVQQTEVSGSSDLAGQFSGREVLLVANGENLRKYKRDIENYIRARKPVVISVNVVDGLSSDYIDYYCATHNSKILTDREKYSSLAKPLVLPLHRFKESEQAMMNEAQIVDFGVQITPEVFEVFSSKCVIPYEVTAAYAFAIAINGQAKAVKLVGFDGYQATEHRQSEMLEILSCLSKSYPEVDVTALTPTSYPVRKGSVFAPLSGGK